MKLSELLCADTPVMVQGATGHAARRHMALMRRHGTNIVAGVSPGRAGEAVDGIDIHSTCAAARAASAAVIAIQFVPARQVAEAAREALESGIKLLVTVTEGVPVHDSARIMRFARERGAIWIGPSTPGVTIPGVIKLGFMPDVSLKPGPIGVMSKSGTLAYEVCHRLVRAGLGQSTWIGVGGDPVKGTRFSELLDYFGADPRTKSVVAIGEIGGMEEEELAQAIEDKRFGKPCHCLVAGASAPAGKTLGHAGALVHGHHGSFDAKVDALSQAGVSVQHTVDELIADIQTSLATA